MHEVGPPTEEPDSPLGFLADQMTNLLPEGVKAVIFLSQAEGDRQMAMTHLAGYDDDADNSELLTDALVHVKALFQACGVPLVTVPFQQPIN